MPTNAKNESLAAPMRTAPFDLLTSVLNVAGYRVHTHFSWTLSLPIPPSGTKAHPEAEGISLSWGEVRQPALAEYLCTGRNPEKNLKKTKRG